MQRFFLVCAMILAGWAAHAQEVLSPNPDIEATISGQFQAFVAEDVDSAWTFANPTIQRLFQTPGNFGRMVQQGYPMVWDPGQITFVDLQQLGSVIVQRVEVIDQAGTAHMLGYSMVQIEGNWRINGVQVLRAPSVGA